MLKAGKYYVGDLCYIIGKDRNGWDWGTVLDETGYLGLYQPGTEERLDDDETTGYFRHGGVKFFSSSTHSGDGTYKDKQGREYWVDAGLIGCFPMENLPKGIDTQGGQVVEFESDFSCCTVDDDGVIEIGNVKIDTDPTEEDEGCWYCGDTWCDEECQEDDEDEEDE